MYKVKRIQGKEDKGLGCSIKQCLENVRAERSPVSKEGKW